MTTLTLGGVVFQGFEVPERINFGGRQALVTHKLPGGSRVVDAMGRDDDDIAWSGRFRGSAAASRARTLDAMRVQGRPVTLSWGAFRYRVLISEFKAEFRQSYEIPYSITCLVVTDETAGTVFGLPGLVEALAADVANALGLSGPYAAISAAMSTVQTAVSDLQFLDTISLDGLGAAVSAARSAASTASTAANVLLNLPTADGPDGFAASLTNQAAAFGRLSDLYQITGNLNRMAANAANYGS